MSKWYHGTRLCFAKTICDGGINVDIGGGELGKGFYVGDRAYAAFAKAWHTCKLDKCNHLAVVEFDLSNFNYGNFKVFKWNREKAGNEWKSMRVKKETRNKVFNCDIIKAPLLGGRYWSCQQMKFESICAQSAINDTKQYKRRVL